MDSHYVFTKRHLVIIYEGKKYFYQSGTPPYEKFKKELNEIDEKPDSRLKELSIVPAFEDRGVKIFLDRVEFDKEFVYRHNSHIVDDLCLSVINNGVPNKNLFDLFCKHKTEMWVDSRYQQILDCPFLTVAEEGKILNFLDKKLYEFDEAAQIANEYLVKRQHVS